MRNLSLISVSETRVSGSQFLSHATVDSDTGALLIAGEYTSDEGTCITIWEILDSKVEERALFTSTSPPVFTDGPLTLSFRVIAESHTLVLILRNGEIATLSLDDDMGAGQFESVGEVETGLRAACWSPDESSLILVTGDDKLLLMTSSFDTLSENPLRTSDFGQDSQTNVGWGSKSTQFHGSLGKDAARAATVPQTIGLSPDDDAAPRISWRDDGSFFVVSSLDPSSSSSNSSAPHNQRILRVYNRQGVLQSTSEPIAGLEHSLSWRPSGNLIASCQRFGKQEGLGKGKEGRHDVVFFERNGLRHGEFSLHNTRWRSEDFEGDKMALEFGYRVKELAWNADSTILAVWIEARGGDVVQLWTTGNYHWYLKAEIYSNAFNALSKEEPVRFSTLLWHPEESYRLLLLTSSSQLIDRTYTLETSVSRVPPPSDTGSVAVIDGNTLNLTIFRTQNVPPPMSSLSYPLSPERGPPISSAFSSNNDSLALLWEDGYVQLIALHSELSNPRRPPMKPEVAWSGTVGQSTSRQIFIRNNSADPSKWNAVLLATGQGVDRIHFLEIDSGACRSSSLDLPGCNGVLIESLDDGPTWQSSKGEIYDLDEENMLARQICSFPAYSLQAIRAVDGFVGLSASGNLYLTRKGCGSRTLAAQVNSFTINSGMVIYTTTSHEAFFAPLSSAFGILDSDPDSSVPEWERRRVERGSRIVTSVSSNMSLILQMPRGNLETVYPRPLVMANVRLDIDNGCYRSAFIACRKHRIDLNVLVEHDHDAFVAGIPSFVDQLDEVDYINLFLSGVGRASQAPDRIAKLCDAIRQELEKRDMKKYMTCILTAHIVKTPPDYESALSLLLRLRKESPSIVEDAVKYIIFLADADLLYNTALGMYDFSLVLMIAQQSQKDPREYIPFLRDLRSLDTHYQHFKIDEHLKRYNSALRNLHLAVISDNQYFSEALTFVEKHGLYLESLDIWKGDQDKLSSLLELYGDYLYERRSFEEAAAAFRRGSKLKKAMLSHERALQWRDAFELAHTQDLDSDDLFDMARRLIDDLIGKRLYSDAAQIALDYCQDVEEAILYLSQGDQFSEAKRLAMLHGRHDLVATSIHPAILNSRSNISDEIVEMGEQFEKQRLRVRELRSRMQLEPDAFYGMEENLHNIDAMTDVSTPYTAFTRYTVADSVVSRSTSKRSQKLKRRRERKAGKKGTVEEEVYLLGSITKLASRLHATQVEVRKLIPHLMSLPDGNATEAVDLQRELSEFVAYVREGLEEIWTSSAEDEPEAPSTAHPSRIDPLLQHPKPPIDDAPEWSLAQVKPFV